LPQIPFNEECNYLGAAEVVVVVVVVVIPEFNIFPNPVVNNVIMIGSMETNYSITNLTGREVICRCLLCIVTQFRWSL
jgi:hypothetical protein